MKFFYQHSCLEMAQEVGNLLASRYPMKGWQDQMQKSTKVSEQLPFNYKMLSQHGAFNFSLSPFAHFIQPTKSLSYHTVVNRSPQNSFVVYLISLAPHNGMQAYIAQNQDQLNDNATNVQRVRLSGLSIPALPET